MNKTILGGLESTGKTDRILTIGGTRYTTGGKYRYMLRDLILDWETFLNVYQESLDYDHLFSQVVKLLNIKENENLRESMIDVIQEIYKLPAKQHLLCMMKQFMIYEPVSIAIHSIYIIFKHHFENIVKSYCSIRNAYIEKNKLNDAPNDWNYLINHWNEQNNYYELDSSSIILLFINPPKGIKTEMRFLIKGNPHTTELMKAIKKYHYTGFCPKVPHRRLTELLNFPFQEFKNAILSMDKNISFPNYTQIEKEMRITLGKKITKPIINRKFNIENPPSGLKEKMDIIKWYVSKILEMRKELLPEAKLYENYYTDMAEQLQLVSDKIVKLLKIKNVD